MGNRTAISNLKNLFSLHKDQASPEVIDITIRENTRFDGTNLWVLMCAIVVASVGLNVNSTAVIIGAMLISPLMGPIIGAGYGAGIRDFALIRKALRNLAVFVSISLFTSTLYFLVSPLHDAQSELLARTTPNIWDVLIAFFGGAAGMVGLTRKEKTTVIPGVAIATALMPPLCTAGYGLATWQPYFFLGAFYLFTINGVFIGLATLTVTRILRLPFHTFEDEAATRRGRIIIAFLITATLLPSLFLASRLVKHQLFINAANSYIDALIATERSLIIADHLVDAHNRSIRLSLVGSDIEATLKQRLETRMQDYPLSGATLDLHVANLSQFRGSEPSTSRVADQQKQRILLLEEEVRRLSSIGSDDPQLIAEIHAQYPHAKEVTVARVTTAVLSRLQPQLLVMIDTEKPLPLVERQRLERWLTVRLPSQKTAIVNISESNRLRHREGKPSKRINPPQTVDVK
jgi:uncharacterized hydrophobic protein (TIGR00271 family)